MNSPRTFERCRPHRRFPWLGPRHQALVHSQAALWTWPTRRGVPPGHTPCAPRASQASRAVGDDNTLGCLLLAPALLGRTVARRRRSPRSAASSTLWAPPLAEPTREGWPHQSPWESERLALPGTSSTAFRRRRTQITPGWTPQSWREPRVEPVPTRGTLPARPGPLGTSATQRRAPCCAWGACLLCSPCVGAPADDRPARLTPLVSLSFAERRALLLTYAQPAPP